MIDDFHISELPIGISSIIIDPTPNVEIANVQLLFKLNEDVFVREMPYFAIGSYNYWLLLSDFESVLHEENFTFKYRIRATNNANPPGATVFPEQDWIVVNVNNETNELDENIEISPRNLTVFPNPFNILKDEFLQINIRNNKSNSINVSLFNIKGQKVSEKSFNLQKNQENTIKWDINETNLATGIYFYRIETPENSQSGKLLLLK